VAVDRIQPLLNTKVNYAEPYWTCKKSKMTDSPPDDARLRATETQMRHALGLRGNTPRTSASGSPPQRHRFVRDGEVPVTVLRRDHQPDGDQGAKKLDAARQAIRSEATAKEHAERLLEEAQATIRDLQTKLGHERLARDEALETVRRLETETQGATPALQTAEAELAAECLARRTAEDALAEALEARQEAEQRRGDALTVQKVRKPAKAPAKLRTTAIAHAQDEATVGAQGDPAARSPQPRRRGRPANTGDRQSEFVEWWKPGWKER
jgi:hypothetical protein